MLIIDCDKFVVNKNGIIVELSKIEMQIIKLLAKVPGKVYSRNQIFQYVFLDRFSPPYGGLIM